MGFPAREHQATEEKLEEEEEHVLFEQPHSLPESGLSTSRCVSAGIEGDEDEDNVLFDASADGFPLAENEVCLDEDVSDFEEDDCKDGDLGPPEGAALPVLGSASLSFDASTAAKYCCQQASQGSSAPAGVPLQLRRLLWMRWLGVIRGQSPKEWLEELRPRREAFVNLLEEVRSETKNSQCQQWAKMRKLIQSDIARCFSDVPRLSCGAFRCVLRQVLDVHLLRHRTGRRSLQGYCQGYHELAAMMLLICMDGTWPQNTATGQELAPKFRAEIVSEDLAVYEALGSLESIPADALALLEALLYDCRLADMFETDGEKDSETAAAIRCRNITSNLRRVAPDLATQVESWGLAPHVILLRWVRLLFLRELRFPDDILAAWDALFADATVFELCGEVLPSSAALPLADFLAVAMIMAASPTKPEELLRFGESPQDVRRLLPLAWQLRDFLSGKGQKQNFPRISSASESLSSSFPQPPRMSYPSVQSARQDLLSRGRSDGKDHRYSLGESLGSQVFGKALGWAASQLSGAVDSVLASGHRESSAAEGYALDEASAQVPPKNSQRWRSTPSPGIASLEHRLLQVPPMSPEEPYSSRTSTSNPADRDSPLLPGSSGRPPGPPFPRMRKPRQRRSQTSSCPSSTASLSSPCISDIGQPQSTRFQGIFSSPSDLQEAPAASDSEELVNSSQVSSAEIAAPSQPFWAASPKLKQEHAMTLPEMPQLGQPSAHSVPDGRQAEPSAEGVMQELDALQAMLQSFGRSKEQLA
eukprot:TRINITY_DN79759_c0_g1_i1.p1 TRINITY_DN79759_c0_g1~~TRINITY_DN79759_c0_g1_i1.p1  ORF type:complete len:773 (+),score=152.75 TRINITY_DN79759_c0_g1_i1:37-2319(+)